MPRPLDGTVTNTQQPVKVYTLKRTSSGTTRASGMSYSYVEQLKGMSRLVRASEKVVHWRRESQTTSVFLP